MENQNSPRYQVTGIENLNRGELERPNERWSDQHGVWERILEIQYLFV
jgi:hypothetical protein